MPENTQMNPQVRRQVADELGLYVYMLVDPESGIPFYVGKGRGERYSTHGTDAMLAADLDPDATSEKIRRIRAIREAGHEPEIWIVRHGMSSQKEYTAVEAACIDLLRSMPVLPKHSGASRLPEGHAQQLSNARREASSGHGIIRLEDLYEEKAAPPLTTDEPLLIVSLGGWVDSPEVAVDGSELTGYGYKNAWLTRAERLKHLPEIAHSASKWFKFTEREVERRGIEFAVAAHRGVTRALLRIEPGSWKHIGAGPERRSGFRFEIVTEGPLFDEVVGEYGHRLPPKKRGEQSTFRYWPYGR
ncbi:LEM-3-like GIY-YIG domain-containing protein [Microbacterium sp. NPDC091676]|uniref:LEM-3-like GIY-YIG domain-containing protein n=1 Tax=Microbacterium sp. NPDC091676 TaxID=3364212 RepID=UPI003818D41E